MKNLYNPDKEDVLEWVNSKEVKWPNSDWDHYVIDAECDSLVFDFANQNDCPQQLFFVHVLHLLVGIYFNENKSNKDRIRRIDEILKRVNVDSSNSIKEWKFKVENLLSGDLNYDSNFWLHHMFYDDISPDGASMP